MRRHLAIAAIYFGKYPSTFKYWMQSCGLNKDIDFYLISDYGKPDEMPENMFYAVSSIQDFENRVQKYLHIQCRLDGRIFKICDFRPLVHIIYQDIFKDYKYVGQCELDMIFGNIHKFLSYDVLSAYRKLFSYGHLTIYRNDRFLMENWDIPFGAGLTYKNLLEKAELCNADEQYHLYSVNRLYLEIGEPVYEKLNSCIADVKPLYYSFRLSKHIGRNTYTDRKTKIIFSWENGSVYGYSLKKGKVKKEEYLYLHMQKRNMQEDIRNDSGTGRNGNILIVPNKFIPYREVDKKFIQGNSGRMRFYKPYFIIHANGIRLKLKRAITGDFADCETGKYKKLKE